VAISAVRAAEQIAALIGLFNQQIDKRHIKIRQRVSPFEQCSTKIFHSSNWQRSNIHMELRCARTSQ
jgi:hypothetical protein